MRTLTLKPGKEESLLRKHPWVFSGALAGGTAFPEDGDWVAVQSHKGMPLGYGHFSSNKSIAIRMLTFENAAPDQAWWNHRFTQALAWRRRMGLLSSPETATFRWIHGEGDGLPGLIVDFYSGVAVLQCHSTGMARNKAQIVNALCSVWGAGLIGVYDKSAKLAEKGGSPVGQDGIIWGTMPEEIWGWEHGHRFSIDLILGQKTGFFIDQRDNRKIISTLVQDAVVLNAFSYTGGFTVSALSGGARRVDSLDSSLRALEIAVKNVEANGLDSAKHRVIQADAMNFVRGDLSEYDVVVLDPPAFAKRASARHAAVQGYKRLNAAALKSMKPGSILATFSCSQAVDDAMFANTLVAAALEAQRNVRILYKLHQPSDHPTGVFHSEGSYLKGLILGID